LISTPPKNYISKSCFEHSFRTNNWDSKCKYKKRTNETSCFLKDSIGLWLSLVYIPSQALQALFAFKYEQYFISCFHASLSPSIYNKSRRSPRKYSCNLGQIIRQGKNSFCNKNTNKPLLLFIDIPILDDVKNNDKRNRNGIH